eukprot:TRINITY_DN22172_c0_g1_i1.p1 TRINITY_DN22172_c0_g1~~TRINITY_DN22172_c0_g1_i1.p1  ORF type:complete len:639 (+),score=168.81 TRINITY_DN22172_c0_g1_i1:74-1990(+)
MSSWQERFAAQYKRYVESLLQPAGPRGLSPLDAEYNDIADVDLDVGALPDEFKTGTLPVNQSKNRNDGVLPNENTKIVLASLGPNDNTYINANYVDGQTLFGVPFNYIATQAPLDQTVSDFWRMIGECGVRFIVCLTDERRTARYWPRDETELLRPVPSYQVQLIRTVVTQDVVTRHMRLINTDSRLTRDITMLHYTAWPEEGVPRTSLGLMAIILTLGQLAESTLHPIVVHCGAGVGRTGVFIAMHVCLALFSMEKELNVKRIVQWLKYQRTGMVKTKLQYQFLVCALNREFQRMVLKHQADTSQQALLTAPRPNGDMSGHESGHLSPLVAAPAGAFKDGRLEGSPSHAPSSPPRGYTQSQSSPLYASGPNYYSTGENPVHSANIPPITRPETLGRPSTLGVGTSPGVRVPPDVAMYPTPAGAGTPTPAQAFTSPPAYAAPVPVPGPPPPAAAPTPPPQANRFDAPPSNFHQALHGVVYGAPGAATPSPAHPAGLMGKRSPHPPAQRADVVQDAGSERASANGGQREVVLDMLQKLDNLTQKHRSAPPANPRPSSYEMNSQVPATGNPTGRISPPRTYGARKGTAGSFPAAAPAAGSAGLGARAVGQQQPQEGVGKYGSEFERSMGLVPVSSSHFDT